jgi:hypothetical protein
MAGHDEHEDAARDQFARLPSSATIATIIMVRPPNAAPPSSTVTRNEIPTIRYRSGPAPLSASDGRKYLRATTGFVPARAVQNVYFTDNEDEIEGRTDKVEGRVLRTEFLKKA